MALSNLSGWNGGTASPCGSSCGGDKPAEKPTACGAAAPEEKPAACGASCGAGDK